MKVHKNQWLLNPLPPLDLPWRVTNQGTYHGVWGQTPSQWPNMGRPHSDMDLQPLENKALSWGIIRKPAYILAEIALRKSQHIPSDLVVNRWASDVESGSHLDLLLQDDVWTTCGRLMSCKIMSMISTAWDFTTKSGGIWIISGIEPQATQKLSFFRPIRCKVWHAYATNVVISTKACLISSDRYTVAKIVAAHNLLIRCNFGKWSIFEFEVRNVGYNYLIFLLFL